MRLDFSAITSVGLVRTGLMAETVAWLRPTRLAIDGRIRRLLYSPCDIRLIRRSMKVTKVYGHISKWPMQKGLNLHIAALHVCNFLPT